MTPRLKTSARGRKYIKAFEGFRRHSAQLPDGTWVVGHGHTKSARAGVYVSEDDAEKLLIYDLLPVEAALNEHVAAPLTQNQFDALASLTLNIGVSNLLGSTILRRLNQNRVLEAALAFDQWRATVLDGRPVVVEALLRRRAVERALFLTPQGGPAAAPTPEVPAVREEDAPLLGGPVVAYQAELDGTGAGGAFYVVEQEAPTNLALTQQSGAPAAVSPPVAAPAPEAPLDDDSFGTDLEAAETGVDFTPQPQIGAYPETEASDEGIEAAFDPAPEIEAEEQEAPEPEPLEAAEAAAVVEDAPDGANEVAFDAEPEAEPEPEFAPDPEALEHRPAPESEEAERPGTLLARIRRAFAPAPMAATAAAGGAAVAAVALSRSDKESDEGQDGQEGAGPVGGQTDAEEAAAEDFAAGTVEDRDAPVEETGDTVDYDAPVEEQAAEDEAYGEYVPVQDLPIEEEAPTDAPSIETPVEFTPEDDDIPPMPVMAPEQGDAPAEAAGQAAPGEPEWIEDSPDPTSPPPPMPEDIVLRSREADWSLDEEAEYSPEADRSGTLWYAVFILLGLGLAAFGGWDTWQRATGPVEEGFLYGPAISAFGVLFMAIAGWFLVKRVLAFR